MRLLCEDRKNKIETRFYMNTELYKSAALFWAVINVLEVVPSAHGDVCGLRIVFVVLTTLFRVAPVLCTDASICSLLKPFLASLRADTFYY